jgi:phage baseplate assembly protein W
MSIVLSHPLRLGPTGSLVTVEQSSDSAVAEALAVLLLTKRGERTLVPQFGINDPTFDVLDTEALNLALATFGPPVTVEGVDVQVDAAGNANMDVTYE